MVGPDQFEWESLEEALEDCRSRGNQMVIRTFLEYPGKKSGLPDEAGSITGSFKTDWRLSKILPGKAPSKIPIKWVTKIGLPAGADSLKLAIRVINPMEGGKPLRFANQTQRENGILVIE